MKRPILANALALATTALCLATPTAAQTAQDQLDARYTQALGAGYKALFLCSAIANAEANGVSRTPESVHQWELSGVYSKVDSFIRDMPYEIVRRPTGQIAYVQVSWAKDMPDRAAAYYGPETGCSVLPIGGSVDVFMADYPVPRNDAKEEAAGDGLAFTIASSAKMDQPQPTALDTVLNGALTDTYGSGRTTAVLVRAGPDATLDGDSLKSSARYAPGFSAKTPQRTWSVAKSIASTLVGMAVHSGEYTTDDPINLNYWVRGGPAEPRLGITIDHALRMATGRYSDTPGNRTDPLYIGGATVDETAVQWPIVHKPGSVFRYANNDTLLAVKAVQEYLDYYTAASMVRKIGMNDTVIETDWRGGYILSSQVWSTAPDLAKLGELYLRNGIVDTPDGEERILPENWREYVSDPSGPQPDGNRFGYGAGWWLLNNSEGVPADSFAAFGNRGQYVVVVPSRNVVIVRRGEDMVGKRFDIAAFTRDVLAALD